MQTVLGTAEKCNPLLQQEGERVGLDRENETAADHCNYLRKVGDVSRLF